MSERDKADAAAIDAAVNEFHRWTTGFDLSWHPSMQHTVLRKDGPARDFISRHATAEGARAACLREALAAVLASCQATPNVPEGWRVVPTEPTYAMVKAGANHIGHWAWEPMLAVAPSPPSTDPVLP